MYVTFVFKYGPLGKIVRIWLCIRPNTAVPLDALIAAKIIEGAEPQIAEASDVEDEGEDDDNDEEEPSPPPLPLELESLLGLKRKASLLTPSPSPGPSTKKLKAASRVRFFGRVSHVAAR